MFNIDTEELTLVVQDKARRQAADCNAIASQRNREIPAHTFDSGFGGTHTHPGLPPNGRASRLVGQGEDPPAPPLPCHPCGKGNAGRRYTQMHAAKR